MPRVALPSCNPLPFFFLQSSGFHLPLPPFAKTAFQDPTDVSVLRCGEVTPDGSRVNSTSRPPRRANFHFASGTVRTPSARDGETFPRLLPIGCAIYRTLSSDERNIKENAADSCEGKRKEGGTLRRIDSIRPQLPRLPRFNTVDAVFPRGRRHRTHYSGRAIRSFSPLPDTPGAQLHLYWRRKMLRAVPHFLLFSPETERFCIRVSLQSAAYGRLGFPPFSVMAP